MKSLHLALIGLTLVSGVAIGQHQPRFEQVYNQAMKNDSLMGYETIFTVFHDKDTGQEIVCIMRNSSTASNSCYLTGRKW